MARNKYTGTCYRCGQNCEPGDGYFEKVGQPQREKWPRMPASTRWQVQHEACARRYEGTAVHYLYEPPALDRKEQGNG